MILAFLLLHYGNRLVLFQFLSGLWCSLFDFFYGFLFLLDDFRCSLVDWFEFLFLDQKLGGLVFDLEVFEILHFFLHAMEIPIEHTLFLDEVIEVQLFNAM